MGCYKPEISQNQTQLEPSKLTLKRSHELTAEEQQQAEAKAKQDELDRRKQRQDELLLEQMARYQTELNAGNLDARLETLHDPEKQK